jgi:hypothetical protein
VQRWMQSVIAHPGGVEAGMAAESTKFHLDVDTEKIEQVVSRSHSQTSIERLAVYANAYYSRLIECLESEFPVFRQTVGEDTFAQFAVEYLQRYPSQSYTLGKLGENFPRYLDETKPPRQPEEPQIGWADFLVDLARLERTFSEVFDGPDVENQPRLTADELLSIEPDLWPTARLKMVPCLRLLSLRFPLNDFYTAAKNGKQPAMPAAADSWMAITRRDYIVRRYELNRPQFLLLNALQRGETISDAIAYAAESYLGETAQFAVELQTWFKIWTAAPMFESVVIER